MTSKLLNVIGEHDEATIQQIENCLEDERAHSGALMADGHLGYAMPIGGVVSYWDAVSPNGVGYDIACGNKAVRLDIRADDIRDRMPLIMDVVFKSVQFGVGSAVKKPEGWDHPLFQHPAWDINPLNKLKDTAYQQLGSVGGGNHYVDIFEDERGDVWIGVHFGSRGLGHKIATGFLNLAKGLRWDARGGGEGMMEKPAVLKLDRTVGEAYWEAMTLAGEYAYAGRDFVCQQVADILGGEIVEEVHNHHNFAWKENHAGASVVVVRKGATPAFPGQLSFIGGSMGDDAVIVRGIWAKEYAISEDGMFQDSTLFSTVHGAGRVMSRTQAAGKVKWKRNEAGKKRPVRVSEGKVSQAMMDEWVKAAGVELRGGGVDESPHVYRRLPDVLKYYEDKTLEVVHTLRPLGVAMAGADVQDPYKD